MTLNCTSLQLQGHFPDGQGAFDVVVENVDKEVIGEVIDDFDDTLTSDEAKEPEATVIANQPQQLPDDMKRNTLGMDKLVYEIVADEEEDEIENAFETTALKVTTLKAKLDMKIDEMILKLQSLKNLRRHVEKSYKFANKFINSKATNEEGKRFVLADLQKSIDQVEETLNMSKDNSEEGIQKLEPLPSSQRNSWVEKNSFIYSICFENYNNLYP